MNLQQLRDSGGIVSPEPVKKPVEWRGKKFNVHVVRQSFGTVEEIVRQSEGRSRSAALIASFIRLGDNGTEQLSYDDAYQLQPELAAEFVRVVNEVYEGDAAKKA